MEFETENMRIKINLFESKLKTEVSILGKLYKIEYSDKYFLKPKVYFKDNRIIVHTSELQPKSYHTVLKKFLLEFSKKEIKNRVENIAFENGFEYNNIAIRDQSTRWGSCSSKKNLNFNWRLIFAPEDILDYVIVHELCHLKEMNHSKKFWDLVGSIAPNYKQNRLWLRENGSKLRIE